MPHQGSLNNSSGDDAQAGSTSPFFRPSSSNRSEQQKYIVVQHATPRGTNIHSRSLQTARSEDGGGSEFVERKSTRLGACSNLINAILGCVIVGIPYALKKSGFVAGIVLLFGTALVTEKSLRLLISTAKHVHVSTYETAMEAVFGITGFRWIAISTFAVSYGSMVSDLMIMKDTFSSVFGVDSIEARRSILLVVSCLVPLPLSCKRDMADLAFTSGISVALDFALIGLILYTSPSLTQASVETNSMPTSFEAFLDLVRTDTIQLNTFFIGLGILIYAFVCQSSAFLIAGSLSRPTVRRWSSVTQSAVSLCAMTYFLCGVTGYVGYREKTAGNILLNLDPENLLTKLMTLAVGISVLFVYPLDAYVSRHVLIVLFFQGRSAHEGDDAVVLNRSDRRYILTLVLYVIAVIPAALYDNFGTVLAISGVIGGSCMSYIGPGVLYLGVHGDEFIRRSNALFWSAEYSDCSIDKVPFDKDNVTKVKAGGEDTQGINNEASPFFSSPTPTTSKPSSSIKTLESVLIYTANNFAWYCLCMPVWCAIARWGSQGLRTHIHEMALKSPYPIRIGDVEYKRVMVNLLPAPTQNSQQPPTREISEEFDYEDDLSGANLTTTLKVLSATRDNLASPNILTSQDLSLFDRLNLSSRSCDINQQIGKNLLEKRINSGISTNTNNGSTNLSTRKKSPGKKHSEASRGEEDVEPDPQEGMPTWYDFNIAILYIVAGFVAMSAGIMSLYYSG